MSTPKPTTKPLTIPEPRRLSPKDLANVLPSRESKYRKILDAMRGLKAGEAVEFVFPSGTDVRKIINCLTSAVVNADLKAPKGCSFFKRVGVNGELVIVAGPAHKRAAAKAPKAAK